MCACVRSVLSETTKLYQSLGSMLVVSIRIMYIVGFLFRYFVPLLVDWSWLYSRVLVLEE